MDSYRRFLEAAAWTFQAFAGVSQHLPLTRESQELLSYAIFQLMRYSDNSWVDDILSTIQFSDPSQIDALKKTENIGWFFLHEDVVNSLPAIIRNVYNSDTRVFHHVPKTGGTSLHQAIYDDMNIFPLTLCNFESMLEYYGLLSVPIVHEDIKKRSSRSTIIAGHFVLADFLAKNSTPADARILTLYSKPKVIVSSAIRYAMSRIRSNFVDYAGLDAELVTTATNSLIQKDNEADPNIVEDAINSILSSEDFYNNFYDPLTKYYLGSGYRSIHDLDMIFERYPNLLPQDNPNERATSWLSDKKIVLPNINKSLVTHNDVVSCIGSAKFERLIEMYLGNSLDILYLLDSYKNIRTANFITEVHDRFR